MHTGMFAPIHYRDIIFPIIPRYIIFMVNNFILYRLNTKPSNGSQSVNFERIIIHPTMPPLISHIFLCSHKTPIHFTPLFSCFYSVPPFYAMLVHPLDYCNMISVKLVGNVAQ